jgi:RNA polymerase sigma-32 factor
MTGMTGRKRPALRVRAASAGTVMPLPALLDLVDSEANPRPVARAGASNLDAYLHDLRRHPLLSRDEEHELAIAYARTQALEPARKLVTANLRLVVRIAQEYRRAHRNLLDLIQEGNLGLIQAVQRYDPFRGVKLSTYAAWWIRAYILKFILSNWRMVRIGTTQAQRRLFFNLRRERERMERAGAETGSRELAAALDVSERDVVEMERRLAAAETSLDAPARAGDDSGRTHGDMVAAGPSARPDLQVEACEFQELLRVKLALFAAELRDRDRDIFDRRLLADQPTTLEQLGADHGISRERARQLEDRLKKKLRAFLEAELGDSVADRSSTPAAATATAAATTTVPSPRR